MKLPRIRKILAVEPYKVTCLWSTGEVREVNLEAYVKTARPQGPIARLSDAHLFNQVKTDGRTLCWDDLLTLIDDSGAPESAPLDFDPDAMYAMSHLVRPAS